MMCCRLMRCIAAVRHAFGCPPPFCAVTLLQWGNASRWWIIHNQRHRLHWLVTLIYLFVTMVCGCDTILLINRVPGGLVCTGTKAWKGCMKSLPRTSYRRYNELPLCRGGAWHFESTSLYCLLGLINPVHHSVESS